MFVTTDYKYNSMYLYFEIGNGRLFVFLNFGVSKSFPMDTDVSDGRWHVVSYRRDRDSVTLSLDDNEVKYTVQVHFDLSRQAPPDPRSHSRE